jgi:hypothetical protein
MHPRDPVPPNSRPEADRTADTKESGISRLGRAAQPRNAPDEARRLAPPRRFDRWRLVVTCEAASAGFASDCEGVGRLRSCWAGFNAKAQGRRKGAKRQEDWIHSCFFAPLVRQAKPG